MAKGPPDRQGICDSGVARAAQGDGADEGGFLNHLYGGMDEPEMKIIDVFICKLRKKLALAGADNLIGTVWGRGYMIREPSPRREHHTAGDGDTTHRGLKASSIANSARCTPQRSAIALGLGLDRARMAGRQR